MSERELEQNRLNIVIVILSFLIQFAWGTLQSVAGLIFFLFQAGEKHYMYRTAVVTEWDEKNSLSLGPFIFVSKEVVQGKYGAMFIKHEYGHTLQSLFFGELYLPLFGIPSFLWCNIRRLGRSWRKGQRSYFSFYTERFANYLGGVEPKQHLQA